MNLSFEDFEIDTVEVTLTGPAGPVDVERQVFDLIVVLATRAGSLVTKHDLLDEVWGDRFVSDSALTSRISSARRALGDDGRAQRIIQTVHGRGYRFLLPVTRRHPAEPTGPGPPRPGPTVGDRLLTRSDSGGADHTARARFPPTLAAEVRLPCAGREAEHNRLRQAASDGPRAGVGVHWVVGEPGIGKTRLVADVAGQLVDEGTEVIFGRCSQDLAVPYQPVAEALRDWLERRAGSDRDSWWGLLGDDGPELRRLLGDLGVEAHRRNELSPDVQRRRLIEAVAGWLRFASADHPLVLVADDLHWATGDTLTMLAQLMDWPAEMNVTVLATARDTAPDDTDELRALRARAATGANGGVVTLGGLAVEAVAAMIGDGDRAASIWERTAGNPLLVRALHDGEGADGPPAVGLDDAVRRRIATLDDAVGDVLRTASVIGLEFEGPMVAEVSDLSEENTLDLLDVATSARLAVDIGMDRYRFTHGLVRDALGAQVPLSRRHRIHRRIAGAIESRRGEPGFDPTEAFFHLDRSGAGRREPDRLASLAAEAADHLAVLLDTDRAVAVLDGAIDALAGAEHGVARLWSRRAVVQMEAGLSVPASESWRRAFEVARAENDAEVMTDAAIGFEDATWRPGLHGGEALDLLDRAAVVTVDAGPAVRARLALARARASYYAGDLTAGDTALAGAEPAIDRSTDPVLQADLLSVKLMRPQHIAEPGVGAAAGQLRAVGRKIGSTDREMQGMTYGLIAAMRSGRTADADRLLGDLTTMAAQHRSRFWAYVATTHEVSMAIYRGDLATADRCRTALLDRSSELVGEDTAGATSFQTFLLKREQDALAPLAPLIRHLVAASPAPTLWAPGLAILYAELGDLERALAALTDLDPATIDDREAMWPAIATFLAEILARAPGRDERAATVLERLEPHRGHHLVVGHGLAYLGAVDRVLGLLHGHRRALDHAARCFVDAEELDTEAQSPLWSGHDALNLAAIEWRRGRSAAAHAALGRAERRARDHRLPALERRVRELRTTMV